VESAKAPYPSHAALESLVSELNEISNGCCPEFFSLSDYGKYVSLKCSGCLHSAYVWFTYDKRTLPHGGCEHYNITFYRFPYGHSLHLNPGTHGRRRSEDRRKRGGAKKDGDDLNVLNYAKLRK
jgi:hypothetical protein